MLQTKLWVTLFLSFREAIFKRPYVRSCHISTQKFLTCEVSSDILHNSRASVVWNQSPCLLPLPLWPLNTLNPFAIPSFHNSHILQPKLKFLEFFEYAFYFSALFLSTWSFLCTDCLSTLSPHLANTYSSLRLSAHHFIQIMSSDSSKIRRVKERGRAISWNPLFYLILLWT